MAQEDEELKFIEVIAQRKYGKPFHMLTEEEQAAIYRDYEGERDVQNAEYAQGEAALQREPTKGIQAGNVYVGSGYGNVAADVLRMYSGKRRRDKAKEELGQLSKDYQTGSRAAGQVAMHQQQQLANALRGAGQQPATASVQQPSPQLSPVTPQGQQVTPNPLVQDRGPKQNVNSIMAERMRGRGSPAAMPGSNFQAQMPSKTPGADMSAEALKRAREEEMMRALRGRGY